MRYAHVGAIHMTTYNVMAHWDAEAHVWWAESEDVPGLAVEAESWDALLSDLRVVVPDLLTANDARPTDGRVHLHLVTEETEELCLT